MESSNNGSYNRYTYENHFPEDSSQFLIPEMFLYPLYNQSYPTGSLVWMRSDIDKETGDVYTCDNVMKAGEKFGEIALIRKRMRTATIVCCEDSELLMVDKKLFDQFCPNLFNEQLKLKVRIT